MTAGAFLIMTCNLASISARRALCKRSACRACVSRIISLPYGRPDLALLHNSSIVRAEAIQDFVLRDRLCE
ncbi:hypothetical protein, partial [Gluconacetobacter entanii]|uniref:hypothetical protein n=1 Tax=Gluconacetobacter entanii TaxID=108528 RepID=UPI0022358699